MSVLTAGRPHKMLAVVVQVAGVLLGLLLPSLLPGERPHHATH